MQAKAFEPLMSNKWFVGNLSFCRVAVTVSLRMARNALKPKGEILMCELIWALLYAQSGPSASWQALFSHFHNDLTFKFQDVRWRCRTKPLLTATKHENKAGIVVSSLVTYNKVQRQWKESCCWLMKRKNGCFFHWLQDKNVVHHYLFFLSLSHFPPHLPHLFPHLFISPISDEDAFTLHKCCLLCFKNRMVRDHEWPSKSGLFRRNHVIFSTHPLLCLHPR